MTLVSWLGTRLETARPTVARNTSTSAVLMVVAAVHELTGAIAAFIPGVSDDPLTPDGILSRSLAPSKRAERRILSCSL